MQNLKRFTSTSRFFSTTQQKVIGKCSHRKKIPDFLQEVFIQNAHNISRLLPKSDLKFANLVAYNAYHFNVFDEKLSQILSTAIKEQIGKLTPELAVDLVMNLREMVSFEDPQVFRDIFNYCQKNFFLFDKSQLKMMESVFMSMGLQFVFDIDMMFPEERFKDKRTGRKTVIEKTKENLAANNELLGLNIPKDELDIIVHPLQKAVEIRFKKAEKKLTLVGLVPEEWESVRRAKDMIYKDDYDFYLLETPPVMHSDIVKDVKQVEMTNKKKKKAKESIIDRFIPSDPNDENIELEEDETPKPLKPRSPYLDYFDKYDRMALMQGPLLEWYVDTFLKDNSAYKMVEAETVVMYRPIGL